MIIVFGNKVESPIRSAEENLIYNFSFQIKTFGKVFSYIRTPERSHLPDNSGRAIVKKTKSIPTQLY